MYKGSRAPPFELNGPWNVGTLEEKKVCQAFTPPLLMARPLREEPLLWLPYGKTSTNKFFSGPTTKGVGWAEETSNRSLRGREGAGGLDP